MLAFTHTAAGCASALLVAEYLHASPSQAILIVAGGILGSHLPDIDHPKSAFGSRVLPLSLPISAIFGHRGITHSLLAVAGMSGLIWWTFNAVHWQRGYAVPVVVGIAVGYLSHLLGDWLTNSGVPLLWPSKRRFVAPIKLCTGDLREYLLAFAMYGWSVMDCVRVFHTI
jgi:inner membrane protein